MSIGIRRSPTTTVAIAAALLCTSPATHGEAQTLRGRVLEGGTDRPVVGAALSLVDASGRHVTTTDSGPLGHFTLTPPQAGDFTVRIVRIGYEEMTSPLISFTDTGEADVDFELRPLPIGLDGLDVSVESEPDRYLTSYGLSEAQLGSRWIDRGEIEAVTSALRTKDVIRWAGVGGVYIHESNGSPGTAPLCVGFWRAKSVRSANPPCAITFLNGARIDAVEANQITPNEIESIAVLTPLEATFLHGTQGSPGAVMIWTRQGGR